LVIPILNGLCLAVAAGCAVASPSPITIGSVVLCGSMLLVSLMTALR
jgi:hypothetical protein